MRIPHAVMLALCALACPLVAQQKYVDDDAPNDPGPGDSTISDPQENGSLAHPFDSLQQAIGSPNTDEIIVLPGRYTGLGNSNLQVQKSLFIRSERGANETIFDMQSASSFLTIGPDNYVVLRGLAVENAVGATAGAIQIAAGGETFVEHCIFRRNHATNNGVAGGAITAIGSVEVHGCAFIANSTAGLGGALAIAADSDGFNTTHDVLLSTFRNNTAALDGGAIYAVGIGGTFTRSVRDSILWDNSAIAGENDNIGLELPGNISVQVSFIQGGYGGGGALIQDVDPIFVRPLDFHVATHSPVQDLTGDIVCSYAPWDADMQVVPCSFSLADVGGDEIQPITYTLGTPTAGGSITVVVAGVQPFQPVTLVVGTQLASPPIATPYGPLEVADLPPQRVRMLPTNPNGASWITLDLSAATQGDDIVLQALAGTRFTQATTVEVK